MPKPPEADRSREGADDHSDASHRPDKPPAETTEHPSRTPDKDLSPEQEEDARDQLRDECDDASCFVADPNAGIQSGGSPISVMNGWCYVLLPMSTDARFWADPRLRIGLCKRHPLPHATPPADNPCPFQLVSVLAGKSRKNVLRAAWMEALLAHPDLPRHALWKNLLRNWRVVRLDLSAVRAAWLPGDPSLEKGEPQLRLDGEELTDPSPANWTRVRSMLRSHAAIVTVPGDPESLPMALRLLVFVLPAQALWEAGALQVSETPRLRRSSWWPGFQTPRLALGMRMLLWPRHKQKRISGSLFQLRMWWANFRTRRAERRAEKQQSLSTRREEHKEARTLHKSRIEFLRDFAHLVKDIADAVRALVEAATAIVKLVGLLIVVAPPAIIWLIPHMVHALGL